MAITIHDAATGDGSSGTTYSWSHTVSAGSNKILVVFVGAENGTTLTAPASVTYGGVNLTLGDSTLIFEGSLSIYGGLWYLLNPAEGADTITVTEGTNFDGSSAVSCTLQGAALQAPEVTEAASTTVDGTVLADSITTLTDNAMIISGMVSNIQSVITPAETLVDSIEVGGTGNSSCMQSFEQVTLGAKSMSFTSAGTFGRAAIITASFTELSEAGDSITIADIHPTTVFPRVYNGTTKNIVVSGVYAGQTPNSIEARVINPAGSEIVTWTTLTSATIGTSVFSGTLASVPQGGGRESTYGYRLQVRSKTAGDAVIDTSAGANYWGVGKCIAVLGSSTAGRWFTDATATVANERLSKYDGSFATCTGSAAIAFGNDMITNDANIPICLLDYGVGSTTLVGWESEDSNYDALITGIGEVGGIEAAVCHVGSNDARNENVASASAHETLYGNLIASLRSSTEADLPFFVWGCQRAPLEPSSSDVYWTRARQGEIEVCNNTSDAYLGTTVIDLEISGDNIHLSAAAMATAALRVSAGYNKEILENADNYIGPVPLSLVYDVVTGWGYILFTLEESGLSLVGKTSQENLTGIVLKAEGLVKTPLRNPYVSDTNRVSFQLLPGLTTVTAEIMTGTVPSVTNDLFDNS